MFYPSRTANTANVHRRYNPLSSSRSPMTHLRSEPSPVLIPYISHLSSSPPSTIAIIYQSTAHLPLNHRPHQLTKPAKCCVSQWEIRGSRCPRPLEGYKYAVRWSVVTRCTRYHSKSNQMRNSEHMLHERRKPRLNSHRHRRMTDEVRSGGVVTPEKPIW